MNASTITGNTRNLIMGMRQAFERGDNIMEWAKTQAGIDADHSLITLLAYDLQAGGPLNCGRAGAQANPQGKTKKFQKIAALLEPHTTPDSYSLMEVGCGEAVTLAGVLKHLENKPHTALGLDISWSRIAEGRLWLEENGLNANLCVADLFSIPLADNAVDVVYTSHALEPNGGREEEALRELLRVARRTAVLVEPIYELGSPEAQARMEQQGYIRGLHETAKRLGANVLKYERVEHVSVNPLNPSGVLILRKADNDAMTTAPSPMWHCPLTRTPLNDYGDALFAPEPGLVYPRLRGIPLLRPEHAVVASRFAASDV